MLRTDTEEAESIHDASGGVLALEDLKKSFGATVAVDGLSLTVHAGECVALIGPSGCGKTTVLRMIAGLDVPDAGRISYAGKDWANIPPQRRNVAMVFQHFGLYPNRTVRGNIEYPLRLRNTPEKDRLEKVEWISDLLGIKPYLDRKTTVLSGGEAQRVALARALVRQPTCFLMDEPLSNLDAQLRLHARAEIKRVQSKLGVTTIYVTHDQEEAIAVGDRIALMNKGCLVQVGTPEEVFQNPSAVFVAQFLGKPPMNLLPGRVVGQDFSSAAIALEACDGAPQAATLTINKHLDLGTRLLVGFRADDLRVQSSDVLPQGIPAWFINGKIVLVDGLSPEYIVHCATPFGPVLFRARSKPSEAEVGLVLPGREAYLFDAATGERIRDVEFQGVESRTIG